MHEVSESLQNGTKVKLDACFGLNMELRSIFAGVEKCDCPMYWASLFVVARLTKSAEAIS
jgi:hypothetical protein